MQPLGPARQCVAGPVTRPRPHRPAPSRSQTITVGKVFQPARTHVLDSGQEGLSISINPAGTIMAVGLRTTQVKVRAGRGSP